MSTLIAETKTDKIETMNAPDPVQKKKNNQDIPSPKKPFTILQVKVTIKINNYIYMT